MSLFGRLKQKMTGSSSTGKPKEEPVAPVGGATTKQPAKQSPAPPAKGAGAAPAAAAANGPSSAARPTAAAGPAHEAEEKDGASSQLTQHLPQRRLSKSELLKPMQQLSEAPASQRQQLLVQKLRLCCILFEWDDVSNARDSRPKEVKRQMLLELLEFVGKNKGIFTDVVLVELMNMVRVNLFRSLPPKQVEHPHGGKEGGGGIAGGEGEEEDPVFEPAWPHLQIVYELFLRFIVSTEVDIRTLKKHINGQFVLKLLELFDSEDSREREYLKTILHRIYAKFMSLRAFIRKAINNVFYTFMYASESHNGIAELLEILGSIINGFALPLKQEHKTFLKKVLIPMHKVKNLSSFHQQLTYCITQFVDKDSHLAIPVILGLIKYWPVTNSAKEVLFLNELEEVLDLTQTEEFKQIVKPLFTHLCRSVGSPHFQVAERALFLWHNEYISGLIADFRAEILPIVYQVLYTNAQSHWNPTVNNLTLNVLKIFQELDPALLDECQQRLSEENPDFSEPPPLNGPPSPGPATPPPPVRTGPEVKDRKEKLERWARVEASIPPDRLERFKRSLEEAAPVAAATSTSAAGPGPGPELSSPEPSPAPVVPTTITSPANGADVAFSSPAAPEASIATAGALPSPVPLPDSS